MRVISGTAKGRPLKSVPGISTRPTTDKVKEAIFSVVGPYFNGGKVLDLFAGSGALGIEALSRGMDEGIFIDLDRTSVQIIRHNLAACGFIDRAEVYRNDAVKALKQLAKREMRFDLLFLDPPYRIKNMDELLQQVDELGLMAEQATIVIEHDSGHHYPEWINDFQQIRHAEYGETGITYYTYTKS